MDAISGRLGREFPRSDAGWGAVVIAMQENIVGNSRTMLLVLLGAVGLAALTGYLDYVLYPALAFFIGLTIYAIYTQKT
jgi:hypothetical protein